MSRWIGFALYLVVMICILAPARVAMAAGSDRDSALCEGAIVRGARAGGVPQEVLHAISLTETGRHQGGRLRPWPWAINREGRGHWFATRAEALDFARKSVAAGRHSFDVGCFQINYHWHGHNFPSLESMFDPDVGAAYAARFLGDLYAESGDWSVAAGKYHSRTPQRAQIYRARFDRIRSGLTGMPVMVAAAPAAAEGRTKVKRGPLIITIKPRGPEDGPVGILDGRMAAVKAERVEKALPGSEDAPAVAVLPAGPSIAWSAASGRARNPEPTDVPRLAMLDVGPVPATAPARPEQPAGERQIWAMRGATELAMPAPGLLSRADWQPASGRRVPAAARLASVEGPR